MQLDEIQDYLNGTGLIVRAGFEVKEHDLLPPLANGKKTVSVVIIGNVGPVMWRCFIKSCEAKDGLDDPMDRWTRRVMIAVADRLKAGILFPFDGPPWWPFQHWSLRCEDQAVSQLQILIHPKYGLWHALRAALLFDHSLENISNISQSESACIKCKDKPCLTHCPVMAYTDKGLNVSYCTHHLAMNADCLTLGCHARNACPQGDAFTYDVAEHIFHLHAFWCKHR